MATSTPHIGAPYTLEQAEEDISNLIGGLDKLTESHFIDDANTVPDFPATGVQKFSSSGQLKYLSSLDGNAYNTGNLALLATGATSMGTGFTTITGLSVALAAGTYVIDGQLLLSPGVTGGTMTYQPTLSGGLVAANSRMSFFEVVTGAVVTGLDFAVWNNPVAATSALGANDRVCYFKGTGVVTVAGTLSIQAKLSSGGCTILQFGTYMQVFPVS